MPTLLLHGLGSDRRTPLELFAPVVQDVSGADERIVAPDVRAHGASELIGAADRFTLDALAAEVAAEARDEAEPAESAPFTIIGISMGAALAVRIALAGLLPVERLVLVRPSFTDRPLPDNLMAFPVIAELLRRYGPYQGMRFFRRTGAFQKVDTVSHAGGVGLLHQFRVHEATARAIRLTEIPRNRAFRVDAELGALTAAGVESLVIAAPRDPVHPLAVAERWAGALGVPLERVPARDDGQAAHTDAVRAAVASFLRG
ncbi:alpha/beta hydrolase [Agromyces rhizosphaerae]|uniref:Alpha/beta hydrolase n=1 Tax=Agromyces rhizosphaerae TaxID=88374 RepID=A0A9W6FQK5_9MICO|nr:alpha/beta hydrolase [Agromyces rhizosphaerae]GLI26717.1 alpha/beta hydrolase [Agromyces rhizosphaerae]